MPVISLIALCAIAAVIVGASLYFGISSITAHKDETEGVRYSVLRNFLDAAGAAERGEQEAGEARIAARQ